MNFYVKNLTPKTSTFALDLPDGFYAGEVRVFGLVACDQDGQAFGDAVHYYTDDDGAFRLDWHDGMEMYELTRFETENEAFRSVLGDVVLIHGPFWSGGGRWNLHYLEYVPVAAANRVVLQEDLPPSTVKFSDLKFKTHHTGSGVQARHFFPNGYGISVVQFYGSYGADQGLFEAAVVFHNGKICYSTPITDDVLGHLTVEDVEELLAKIEALPPVGGA